MVARTLVEDGERHVDRIAHREATHRVHLLVQQQLGPAHDGGSFSDEENLRLRWRVGGQCALARTHFPSSSSAHASAASASTAAPTLDLMVVMVGHAAASLDLSQSFMFTAPPYCNLATTRPKPTHSAL